jgi:hypothetical protein
MSVPIVQRAYLLESTIVPRTNDLQTFTQYLTRLYEDIALAVNQRDFVYFTMSISGTATTIPNLPLFGTFFILFSGQNPGLPCGTHVMNKADIRQVGFVSETSSQQGNIAPWVGTSLLVFNNPAPPATGEIDIQVRHNNADPTLQGNFNVRIIGTQ